MNVQQREQNRYLLHIESWKRQSEVKNITNLEPSKMGTVEKEGSFRAQKEYYRRRNIVDKDYVNLFSI